MAGQLPAAAGAALTDAASQAFLRGLVLSTVIGGVGTLVLAVIAAATFRQVPRTA